MFQLPDVGPAERAVMAGIHERNRNAAAAMQLAMAHEELNKECSRLDTVERRLERVQNDLRRNRDAGYSLPRHLDILIAMIGERQLLTSVTPLPD